jgi:hypothetical protein
VPRLPWAQSRGTDPPALLAQLRSGSGEESAAAAEVAELLGFLPLTLEQAGAYARGTQVSMAA